MAQKLSSTAERLWSIRCGHWTSLSRLCGVGLYFERPETSNRTTPVSECHGKLRNTIPILPIFLTTGVTYLLYLLLKSGFTSLAPQPFAALWLPAGTLSITAERSAYRLLEHLDLPQERQKDMADNDLPSSVWNDAPGSFDREQWRLSLEQDFVLLDFEDENDRVGRDG